MWHKPIGVFLVCVLFGSTASQSTQKASPFNSFFFWLRQRIDSRQQEGPGTVVPKGKAARQINTSVSKSGIEFNINDYVNRNTIELEEAEDSLWLHLCWSFYKNIRWPKNPVKHCWNWRGATQNGTGSYGRFHYRNGRYMAHRISWEIHNNQKIPEGKVIRHMCNRPQCVNPHHLQVGTQMENVRDMLQAGRQGYKTKLTPQDIHDIRKSRLKGVELARKYGVSSTTISLILTGKK